MRNPLGGVRPDPTLVERIASLYASQSDAEADSLYRHATVDLSAREKLKISGLVENKIREIQRKNRKNQQNIENSGVHTSSRPTELAARELATLTTSTSLTELASGIFKMGVAVAGISLYVLFWIALVVVVFTMACRIIGG